MRSKLGRCREIGGGRVFVIYTVRKKPQDVLLIGSNKYGYQVLTIQIFCREFQAAYYQMSPQPNCEKPMFIFIATNYQNLSVIF